MDVQTDFPSVARALLVADDAIATAVSTRLSSRGVPHITLDVVDNLNEAQELLLTGAHDVVLLAPPRQAVNGAAVEQLQDLIALRPATTPIVALSDDEDVDTERSLMEAGAEDVLPLPVIDGRQIRQAVRYAIQRARAEERLKGLALFDPLTGLPSQVLFWQFLKASIHRAARRGETVVLMCAYLEGLGPINDAYGNETGDRVLCQAAERLKKAVRTSDHMSRFGGTKFTILLDGVRESADATVVADRVFDVFRQSFKIGGTSFSLGVAIGSAIYPMSASSPQTMLRQALDAMDRAKNAGGDQIMFA